MVENSDNFYKYHKSFGCFIYIYTYIDVYNYINIYLYMCVWNLEIPITVQYVCKNK